MITSINYNWYATPENGEEFTNRKIGQQYFNGTVESIEEHRAQGDGDKWYYDVKYSDGTLHRIFNPNQVIYGA